MKEKTLVERVAGNEHVSRREIQNGLNALLGMSQPGNSKSAKLLAGRLGLNFAKNL